MARMKEKTYEVENLEIGDDPLDPSERHVASSSPKRKRREPWKLKKKECNWKGTVPAWELSLLIGNPGQLMSSTSQSSASRDKHMVSLDKVSPI